MKNGAKNIVPKEQKALKRGGNKMDLTCPNCNREIMFDDEFTTFDYGGDCIIATATYVCPECGDAMTVRATFVWDRNLEVD